MNVYTMMEMLQLEKTASLMRLAILLTGRSDAFSEILTERVLDCLWDHGYVICRGEYCNYDWQITQKGDALSDRFQQLLGDDTENAIVRG